MESARRRSAIETVPRRRSSIVAPVDKVKRVFQACDADGSGTISRNELAHLLTRLGNFTPGEVDRIMNEIDKDESGDIDYDEFLKWISTPGSEIEVRESEAVCFDLESALRPLFKVFDRNDSGSISLSEFHDCYTILSGAFKALPPQDGKPRVAALVSSEEDRIFQLADKDNNNELSFREFVEWQREAIEHSGVSHQQLVELVQRLSCLLQDIFMFSNSKMRRNSDAISEDPLLKAILPKVAACSQQLWRRNSESKRGTCTVNNSVTSDPAKAEAAGAETGRPLPVDWPALPAGLDTQKLVKRHLQDPVPTEGVSKIRVRIHSIVPDLTGLGHQRGASLRWLAKVTRFVDYKDGRKSVLQFYYSYYKRLTADDWAWTDLSERDEFYKAAAALPPELRLYALLLTEADFGESLLWSQIQMVMEDGKKMGLLTSEEHLEFNLCTEKTVMREMEQSHPLADHEQKKDILKKAIAQAQFSPVEVMRMLAHYRLMPEHPLWTRPGEARG